MKSKSGATSRVPHRQEVETTIFNHPAGITALEILAEIDCPGTLKNTQIVASLVKYNQKITRMYIQDDDSPVSFYVPGTKY